jgi:hypothetical protein
LRTPAVKVATASGDVLLRRSLSRSLTPLTS